MVPVLIHIEYRALILSGAPLSVPGQERGLLRLERLPPHGDRAGGRLHKEGDGAGGGGHDQQHLEHGLQVQVSHNHYQI